MANVDRPPFYVGFPDVWSQMATELSVYLSVQPRLNECADRILHRVIDSSTPADTVINTLGTMCWEDFEEIQVLALNGYGFGVLKLLRGLFERVVTTSHLQRTPDDVHRFLDYMYIQDHKLANGLLESGGGLIDKAQVEAKKRLADGVRSSFMRNCSARDCDKRVPMISWSALDLVAMAKKDADLAPLLGNAYYLPMQQTHATGPGVLSRLAKDDTGRIINRWQEQGRALAPLALADAHYLVLLALTIQLKHFPGMASDCVAALEQCRTDFKASWIGKAPLTAAKAKTASTGGL